MPCDYKKYPKNWKEIVEKIKERAQDKCELCFAPNHHFVVRDIKGQFYLGCVPREGEKEIEIILTIHHINFNIFDNRAVNLIALCQRCHLRLDIGQKLLKRKAKKEEGQGLLI